MESNLIHFAGGFMRSIGTDFESKSYLQWVISWAYRVKKRFWVEAQYGLTAAKRFPAPDIGTNIHSLGLKAKYAFELPFYSFLMPYAGGQYNLASSPGAGEDPKATNEENNTELDLVSGMEGFQLALGVTLQKRFVPGWFITANLGTDVMSLGLSVGF